MLTTCQASVSRLPIELLGLIIEYVENISAVSLVSRLFRRAALPLAYHTLKFSRIERIDGFIDLVHTEGNESPSQIGRFLRRLIFHHALNLGHSLKPFDDNLVSRLRVIMPKLVNLEHITWNAWGYATFTRLFADLQPWCPKLRSLDMDAGRKGDNVPSEATDMQVFGFQNLTYLAVKWSTHPDEPLPPSLLKMIQNSPLSTLKLEMRLEGHHKLAGLDLENFFETLGATFPNLRHFEHRSHPRFDLKRVLDPTRGPSTIRSFFLQHPNIETLALDWSPIPSLTDREVEGIYSLFPALRHFSGPTELSAAIVRSPIRLRLEGLQVLRYPIINPSNSYTMVADSIIELPQLRHLSFPAEEEYRNRYWRHLDEHSLKKYFRSASELASLEINGSGRLKEFNESVQAAFDHAPNLKRLKLNLPEKYAKLSSDLVRGEKGNTDARELCQLVSRLARACPLLERITSSGITTPHLVYRLERNHEGLLEKITISAGRDHHTLPVA